MVGELSFRSLTTTDADLRNAGHERWNLEAQERFPKGCADEVQQEQETLEDGVLQEACKMSGVPRCEHHIQFSILEPSLN